MIRVHCEVTAADSVLVEERAAGGVALVPCGESTKSGVFLTVEDTRRLRDYLTAALGDAPEPFVPAAIWAVAKTPTAIELAAMLRAEADDVLTRGDWTAGADLPARAIATALAALAGRLEALA